MVLSRVPGVLAVLVAAAAVIASPARATALPVVPPVYVGVPGSPGAAPIHHVFVIVLENKAFGEWYGPGTPFTPYLHALAHDGALVPNYFGTGHSSADNYVSMIAGQPPTFDSKNDCPDPLRSVGAGVDSNGIAQGSGCEYPGNFETIGDQAASAGLSWRAYAQNMPSPCFPGHDAAGSYVRKHNGFPYFDRGVQDGNCAAGDVPLEGHLAADLAAPAPVASINYIFPNECADGHTDCTHSDPVPTVGGETSELAQADSFLAQWVPAIVRSAAYKDNGLLVITWDEGDDISSCCGEPAQDPDGSYPGGEAGLPGGGGGQVGAVMLSPLIKPGTVSALPYNHYSLLATIEDSFGLPRMAETRLPGVTTFGSDIFTAG